MTPSAGETPRRADIQGLRALAVLLVVLFHADLGFSGGFIGVDVFFVISGFVITSLLLRELVSTNALRLGRFYLRRIRRLMPALGLLVVVVALLSIVAAPVGVQPLAARTGASASAFLANFYLYSTPNGYFALAADFNPFLHTWSLAVEEQFYLVFPVLLLGAWMAGRRRGRSRPYAVAALCVVSLGSFVLSAVMVQGHAVLPGISEPRVFAFYSSFTRAWEFGVGALLALATGRLRALSPRFSTALGIIGVVGIIGPALRYDDVTQFPGINALLPVIGTVLIMAAGIVGTVGVSRLIAIRPAVFIGDISYSWYLWHWPLIVFARATWPGSLSAPTAALISIVPAWLSYRYVENPIRRSQRLTGRRTLAMGAATILAGVLACGVLVLGNQWVTQSDGYDSIQRALRTHRGCPVRGEGRRLLVAGDPEVAARCTWPVENSMGTIALVGDSNAGHISEPVVRAARALDRAVYRATSNGCPFVDVTMVVLGDRRGDCRQFYEKSMRIIERLHPDLVVIGSTTTRYVDEKQFGLIVGRSGPTATSPRAKLRSWQRGLHRTVTRLADTGIQTLVVHPVPKYRGWDLRGCAAGRVALAQFTCGRSTTRSAAVKDGAPALAAEQRAIRGVPGVKGVEFLAQLCSTTSCSTDRFDDWLYLDGDHLSIDGSLTLEPRFQRLFVDFGIVTR